MSTFDASAFDAWPAIHDDRVNALFQTGLHELATGLCQQANGAGDPWDPADIEYTVWYLGHRLREWKPGRDQQARRDEAMKSYVEAALLEWRKLRDSEE